MYRSIDKAAFRQLQITKTFKFHTGDKLHMIKDSTDVVHESNGTFMMYEDATVKEITNLVTTLKALDQQVREFKAREGVKVE